jgi:hypothetical protein
LIQANEKTLMALALGSKRYPLKVQSLNNTTYAHIPMSELGKVEERRSTDISLYHLLRKAKSGLGSDILPVERRECTPAEIKSSVAEAGKVLVNHVTVEQEAYSFSVGSSPCI